MQWISLVGTALGALIAMVATTVNERSKWRREQASTRRKLCQDTYSRFLAALTDAHERMRMASRTGFANDEADEARATAILDVFRDGRCYEARYEIALVAGQAVLDHSERCFQILRDIRDTFAAGSDIHSTEYDALRQSYRTHLRELQVAMRVDLGAESVDLSGGS
ncbi:hypothetical protein [Nocardia alni]|uniref:hypothetical protein n=1 Tax=Nocardia alni TaxID=2815723 RepID=UPI001C22BD33|nr:hypothetical protein [Nocardia alni]